MDRFASKLNKRTRESLLAALSYYSLPDIPEPDNGTDVWIRALALVTKYDGCDYFVCVEKKWDTLTNRVVKDFGVGGAIREYKEIYPFIYLESGYMPNRLDKTKESRINYLATIDRTRSFDGLSIKELDNLIIGYAIKAQLNAEKANKYYKQYYDDYEENGVEGEIGGHESQD